MSDPRFASWLATRENFEAQLRRIAGTEYVVIYDPIASKTRYKNGDFSNVWVIQKQVRKKRQGQEDEVTPLAMYYIVGDAIYQAPSVAKLIGNRMVGQCSVKPLRLLIMKVIHCDIFEQATFLSSSLASLFSFKWTHLYSAIPECLAFESSSIVTAKQRKHSNARESLNSNLSAY